MKIQVTFVTPVNKYSPKSFEIVEVMDSENGSTCDYNLRALAMNWAVKEVVQIG